MNQRESATTYKVEIELYNVIVTNNTMELGLFSATLITDHLLAPLQLVWQE